MEYTLTFCRTFLGIVLQEIKTSQEVEEDNCQQRELLCVLSDSSRILLHRAIKARVCKRRDNSVMMLLGSRLLIGDQIDLVLL